MLLKLLKSSKSNSSESTVNEFSNGTESTKSFNATSGSTFNSESASNSFSSNLTISGNSSATILGSGLVLRLVFGLIGASSTISGSTFSGSALSKAPIFNNSSTAAINESSFSVISFDVNSLLASPNNESKSNPVLPKRVSNSASETVAVSIAAAN